MDGYRRTDGLWDIEGRLLDVKGYDLEGLYRKHVPAGEPIHDILVRVTCGDDMIIHDIEATIDYSPFPMCGAVAPDFASLKGLSLGAGFLREVRNRFGGVRGCTHLVDLLGAVATTAFQTIYPILRSERGDGSGRPALIDSCHAFAAGGEVVAKAWPAYSTRAAGG